MGEARHNPLRMVLYLLSFLTFAATVTFNYLYMYQIGLGQIFINEPTRFSNLTVEFDLDDTWTFSLTTAAYAYQILWLLFLIPVGFCKLSPDGANYSYVDPGFFSPLFHVFFFLACACDLALLFLWDRGFFDYSLIPNGLTAFFLYLCIGVLCSNIAKKAKLILKAGHGSIIWLTWIFGHNALAFWAAWSSILTLGHLGVLLTYRFDIDLELSSTIALACLGFEILVYFLLDATVLDRYLRYTYTPYLTVIFVLVGMVLHGYHPMMRSTIMTVILLGGAGALFVAKVMLSFWRCCTYPLFKASASDAYEVDVDEKLSSTD